MAKPSSRRRRAASTRERTAAFDRAVPEFFLALTLEEARRGLGRTHPEPLSGAILVKGGRIVGRGHYLGRGFPHAEQVALGEAGSRARGADLYVTFEPCGGEHGCAAELVVAGVRRVVYGAADPRAKGKDRGARWLAAARVRVEAGARSAALERLNRPFFHFLREGRPFVTLKAAMSLDGKIATATGDSRWVTGEEARARVHALRNEADAILVGARTVERDDPRLTTRVPAGRDAVRVVVDSRLATSPARKVYTQRSSARTVIATLEPLSSSKARAFAARNVELWQLPARAGRVDLAALLARLGEEGLLHVMVEGGAEVFGTLLRERLADELWLFIAPKLVGSEGLSWAGALPVPKMSKALRAGELQVERVGEDLLVRALLLKR